VIGETLGHYRIERRLGAGGMGMVYAAADTRLGRRVAIKVIHEGLEDASLRERLWREARAAASVDHPAICQVHEVGEERGRLFIVMELLDGQTLEDRLLYGPLAIEDALRIGLIVLDALAQLHRRGLVHRDIKPSNVFLLTDARVKLLDFGLVRSSGPDALAAEQATALTRPGLGVGSPGYMSPEQVLGKPVDARTDIFSLGIVLHEAIVGRRAFTGENAIEIMNAVLKESPRPLRGSPLHEAVGAELARAMAREPDARHPDAAALASALRALQSGAHGAAPAPASRGVTRLAVLPFRMLRPDPERDFLGPSLADAIALSLSGIRSLVVRSTLASARFVSDSPRLDELARELDVDAVLVGTLLAAGERCRVTAQLVEVPHGRVVWSETAEIASRDIFELQDSLTKRIVSSLELPLTERERGALGRDVPASPSAYELFLRANRLASPDEDPPMARDLYVRALEADPHFAPAWARLANCYRIMAKYYPQERAATYRRAEQALSRAFELRPDFPAASLVRAHLDLDGGRTERAVDDLVSVVERNPNDPAGFAGLVTALRYAGFLESSVSAHERARALDPEMKTSVEFTYACLGDIDNAVREAREPKAMAALGRLLAGDRMAAVAMWETRDEPERPGRVVGRQMMRDAVAGDEKALAELGKVFGNFPDPEGTFQGSLLLAAIDRPKEFFHWFGKAVEDGFFCAQAMDLSVLDRYRDDPRFVDIRRKAEERTAKLLERVAPALERIDAAAGTALAAGATRRSPSRSRTGP
jgi:serine/threonine protein kinase/tetratricopeptide (TPR) repeat protein